MCFRCSPKQSSRCRKYFERACFKTALADRCGLLIASHAQNGNIFAHYAGGGSAIISGAVFDFGKQLPWNPEHTEKFIVPALLAQVNKLVRLALVASVACTSPWVSRQIRKLSTVPNAKLPASALERTPSTLSSIQATFVAEK